MFSALRQYITFIISKYNSALKTQYVTIKWELSDQNESKPNEVNNN